VPSAYFRHAVELRNQPRVAAPVGGAIQERQERVDARVEAIVLAEQATEVLDAGDVSLAARKGRSASTLLVSEPLTGCPWRWS